MTRKRTKKKQAGKPEYAYRIERKLVHGELVDVKVYEPVQVPDEEYVVGAMSGTLAKIRESFGLD